MFTSIKIGGVASENYKIIKYVTA